MLQIDPTISLEIIRNLDILKVEWETWKTAT
jgi:hypothetical protein